MHRDRPESRGSRSRGLSENDFDENRSYRRDKNNYNVRGETDRQTGRQTDRQTDRQTETERRRDGETERGRDREALYLDAHRAVHLSHVTQDSLSCDKVLNGKVPAWRF